MFKQFFGGKSEHTLRKEAEDAAQAQARKEHYRKLDEMRQTAWMEKEQQAKEKAQGIFDKEMMKARKGVWRYDSSDLKSGYVDGIAIPDSEAHITELRQATLKALEYAFAEEMRQIEAGTWSLGDSSFLFGTEGRMEEVERYVVACRQKLERAEFSATADKQYRENKAVLEKLRVEQERILQEIPGKLAEEMRLAEQGEWKSENSYFTTVLLRAYSDTGDKVKTAVREALAQLEEIQRRKDAERVDNGSFFRNSKTQDDIFKKMFGANDPFGFSDDFNKDNNSTDWTKSGAGWADKFKNRQYQHQGGKQTKKENTENTKNTTGTAENGGEANHKRDTREFFQGKTTPEQDVVNALKILGLNSRATADEAKSAHRRFMKEHSQRTTEAALDKTTQDLVSVLGRVKTPLYDKYLKKANKPETETA